MILSPFDLAALAPLAALIPPRAPETPVLTSDQHLARDLRFADRGGPYAVDGRAPALVTDGTGHVVAMCFSAPTDLALGRRLAERFARTLNELAAADVRPAAAE
ncbi:hypothetical protein [Methylobacterium sp. OT2]|uniref:hypothetical protein n=1 Tax=Methylobacterium sp. OT2 TaxID=2813779 RepID=UPI00197BFC93|nr:hypothetical protein [Methylobacterium sp. OT2]MBN4095603.1 hypothetical protein [Methylobacterium sp. OT2]